METNPSLIPANELEVSKKFKSFKAEMRACGFALDYGVRQYKCAIIICIGNLIKLAAPELHDDNKFKFTDSTSAESINSKLSYCLTLYKISEPLIRAHIIYG